MRMVVCATFDRKPLVFGTLELARRSATSMMELRGSNSDLEKFPEDFDLFYIGDFDSSLGIVAGVETPVFQFTFGDLVPKREEVFNPGMAAVANGKEFVVDNVTYYPDGSFRVAEVQ